APRRRLHGDALGRAVHADLGGAVGRRRVVVQPAQPAHRGEPPVLLTPAGYLERLDVVGGEPLPRPRDGHLAGALFRAGELGRQAGDIPGRARNRHPTCHPTLPSICSSMSRFSSSAYSMGSSRAIGSTKPRTTMAIASSSVSPRL